MRHFPMGPQIAVLVAIFAALQSAAGSDRHRPARPEPVAAHAPAQMDAVTLSASFALRVPVLQ